MKVLIAGASGPIGRQLIPLLTAAGHEATGLSRKSRPDIAVPFLTVDVLDRDALLKAVEQVRPDAIVNLVTGIPDRFDPKATSPEFQLTNQRRTQGTDNLRFAA